MCEQGQDRSQVSQCKCSQSAISSQLTILLSSMLLKSDRIPLYFRKNVSTLVYVCFTYYIQTLSNKDAFLHTI